SQEEINAKAGQIVAKAGSFVVKGLADITRAAAEFILMFFVMLYAMFFFLIHGQGLLDAVFRYTPLSATERARLLGTFTSVGRATLKGTLIIGIVQGGLAGLSFWVAGIEGVVFWGAVMTVLSIIPGIGSALVWVPAVIFLALNGQTGAAVGVGLWCAIVVGTVDNFLRPMLVGKDTEMPDLLVLLTTLGGLVLFGAIGILIGPIIGALYMAVWELWGSAIDETRGGAPAVATTNRTEK
ncbi:MAG: AI-2E family transporter, partial [Bacteroidota bacterium]